MARNKSIWIAVGVVIVLIVAFFVMQNMNGASQTAENETAGTEDVSAGSVNAGTGSALSYQQAVAKYKDHRIQFSTAYSACQANPNQVTYKDNTGIMLDNRSATAKTIKIGGTYTVKAWGFKVITLPDTYKASKTILVDCDKSQNVATILVQE